MVGRASLSRPHLSAALLLLAACSGERREPRPDVVVILIDTLRPDHLPFQGYDEDTAPFLSSLARRSVVFERAHSTSSWTAPSTASLFTSQYPAEHGVTLGFVAHAQAVQEVEQSGSSLLHLNRMAATAATLGEIFHDAGYRTFAVTANVNVGPEIGFDRGFDQFVRLRPLKGPRKVVADAVAEQLRAWRGLLDEPEPDLVYLHFNDVHGPYRGLGSIRELKRSGADVLARMIEAYDEEIRYLDGVLEAMFAEHGWGEETLVMVVSDHGQELRDHGGLGHNLSLHRELVDVLMMVAGPSIRPGTVDENVGLIDALPTLAELAGLGTRPGWQGASLAPLVTGSERGPDLRGRTLFAHRTTGGEQELWAAIRGRWKLIQDVEGVSRLYDRERDPLETRDLHAAEPGVAAELEARILSYRERALARERQTYAFELDEAGLEQLEALGYVED